MIRLLLADDQPLLLSALRTILDAQDDITVVATAADGAEAVEKTRAHRINVAVLDIRMPVLDGITAARTIMEMGPRVIMLTTFDDDTLIHAAIDAGVHGFLLKDAEPDVLANAVRRRRAAPHRASAAWRARGPAHRAASRWRPSPRRQVPRSELP